MSFIARHIDTCTSSNPIQHESHLQKDRYIYDIVPPLLSLLLVAWQSPCVKKILWCNRGNIMETKVYDGPSHQGTACDYTTQRNKMLFSLWYSFCKTRWRNHMCSCPQTLWFLGITPSPLGFFYWNYAWTPISNQLVMSWKLHFKMWLFFNKISVICHLYVCQRCWILWCNRTSTYANQRSAG